MASSSLASRSVADPGDPGDPATSPALEADPVLQEAFVRAELIRRLFDGSAQSRYFSLVLWPVIAAIYWRQIDLWQLIGPVIAHLAVTVGFDVLRHGFNRARSNDEEVARWGWWFAGLSFLAGACWGWAGFMLASQPFELQRMLLGLVLLATITTAVPIRSAHPPTYYAFAVATTAPLLLVLLISADPFHQLVGIAGGAYVGHLMAYVRDVHRWQYDNIALAYQKEELARRLQVAYDEARTARDAALVAQREAEEANQTKSTFLATVSHEVRTPMNGVLGMIDVLERTPLSAEQLGALGTVRYSASSLLRIIDDILDFSKIEAGRLDLERLELSTAELIEGAAETMAPQAMAKGLALTTSIAEGVPERVIGDPVRLRQILFNLLGNAIKFTERGAVRLVLERVLEVDDPACVVLRIRVSDTGIGLTPDQQRRLFQPFVQADSSTTRRFGGTGLGLSIVRRLAEAMQGEVELHSEAGVGSTFTVTVRLEAAPAAGPSVAQATPILPPSAAGRLDGRVLVVDDNAVNRKILARQLDLAGASTEVVASGEEALRLWRGGGYDLVLADLQMPSMDGFELARRIRAVEVGEGRARTPILAMTASTFEEEEGRSRAAGMDGFITKPIGIEQLRVTLDAWLETATSERIG